uniref:C2H2-type domain-containing protein n=1 Tax=Cyclopterus lumpus TaxID=8103 RepID=A0A8C3GAQ4_CYCLU
MPLRSSVQQRPASQRTHGNSSVELQCQISLNAVQDLVETEIKSEAARETCKATSEQQRTHQCRACLKCFPSVSKLQRHTLTHTGQRPFGCEICGKRFRQKTHLRDFETHAGSDLVSLKHLDQTPCVVIFPSYNRESDKLSPHISKHMEVARTVSTVTVKRTPIPNSMQNPVIVQHKCFCCLKCFPSASKLQRHEMVHTGLKPFPCVLCGKAFRQTKFRSNVTCKKRKLHTCRICFQNFAFPYKLSRHLATHSGMRPYKCTSCSKTFTQRGHLKVHEHRCRQVNRASHYVQGEMINTNHLQEKCLDDLSGRTDCHADIRDDCYQATCDYDQATDRYSYSFPSELSFEIDKLVQNQNMAAPLFSQYESNAHNVEAPCQPKGVTAVSASNELLGDEPVTPLVDNKMPDNYWCEPLNVFECHMCSSVAFSAFWLCTCVTSRSTAVTFMLK